MSIFQFGNVKMTKNNYFLREVLTPLSLVISLAMSGTAFAQEQSKDKLKQASKVMLKKYDAAKAAKKDTEAARYVFEYMELERGKNAPATIMMMQRYGNLLHKDGNSRKAASILKSARKRAIAAFGEYGMELYQLNMDLSTAYAGRAASVDTRKKYFDHALDVLKKNDQGETLLYVKTLLNILSNLTQDNVLKGEYTSELEDQMVDPEDGEMLSVFNEEYNNYYYIAKAYIKEAIELASKLNVQDPYIKSKIAIAQAKVNVLDISDLSSVNLGATGGLSNKNAEEQFGQEDGRLLGAIKKLSNDPQKNKGFIRLANNIRMDIAWMSGKKDKLVNMCSDGAPDMSHKYPSSRLYDVMENGDVFAPDVNLRYLAKNIFKRKPSKASVRPGQKDRKPFFLPVCINGELKAALVNAPTVTVEDRN